MLGDDLFEWARFVAYTSAWRHAPRGLRTFEAMAQRALDRPLPVRRARLDDASIALVGRDDAFAADLSTLLPAGTRCAREGKTRLRDAHAVEADLLLVEVPDWHLGAWTARGFVAAPKRVSHVEPTTHVGGPDDVSFARSLRVALEKSDVTVRETRSPFALRRFHRESYLPTMRARHAERARPTSFELLLHVLLSPGGALVEACEHGRPVASALVGPSPLDRAALQIVVLGVEGGDYQRVRDEVRLAPILFARDRARRQGFARVDHLVTRPLPRHGLFRRKARWGTTAVDLPHRPDRVVVQVRRRTPGLERLLEASPILAFDAHGRLTETVLR